MPFVVDASIVIAWAFDEVNAVAGEARDRIRDETVIAPALWWFEVRNALIQGERRGRFTEFGTARFLRDVSRLAIRSISHPKKRRSCPSRVTTA